MGDTRRGRHVGGCVSELQLACSAAGLSQPCCGCTHSQQAACVGQQAPCSSSSAPTTYPAMNARCPMLTLMRPACLPACLLPLPPSPTDCQGSLWPSACALLTAPKT